MRKTKLEKGITLVALIITIVVLLILAVVSIGAVRDSKIIGHSKDASSQYTVEQEKEQLQLALSEWQLQKNVKSNTKIFKTTIEDALNEEATVGDDDPDDGPLTVTFVATGNKYNVTNSGEIKGKDNDEAISIVGIYGDISKNYYKFDEGKIGEYGYYDDDEKKFLTNNFSYSISDNWIVKLEFTNNSIKYALFDTVTDEIGNVLNKVIYTDKRDETRYEPQRKIDCYEYAYTTNGSYGLNKEKKEITYNASTNEDYLNNCVVNDGQITENSKGGSSYTYTDYFKKDNYLYVRDGNTNVYHAEYVIWDGLNIEYAY